MPTVIFILILVVVVLGLGCVYCSIMKSTNPHDGWHKWRITKEIMENFFGENAADQDHVHYGHGTTEFIAQVLSEPVTEVKAALRLLEDRGRVHTQNNNFGLPNWRPGPPPGTTSTTEA